MEEEVRRLKAKEGGVNTYLALSRIFGTMVMHATLPTDEQSKIADAFRVQANNLGYATNNEVKDFLTFLGPGNAGPAWSPRTAAAADPWSDSFRN